MLACESQAAVWRVIIPLHTPCPAPTAWSMSQESPRDRPRAHRPSPPTCRPAWGPCGPSPPCPSSASPSPTLPTEGTGQSRPSLTVRDQVSGFRESTWTAQLETSWGPQLPWVNVGPLAWARGACEQGPTLSHQRIHFGLPDPQTFPGALAPHAGAPPSRSLHPPLPCPSQGSTRTPPCGTPHPGSCSPGWGLGHVGACSERQRHPFPTPAAGGVGGFLKRLSGTIGRLAAHTLAAGLHRQ